MRAILAMLAVLLLPLVGQAQVSRSQNNDQPIEITADKLEVQQDKQVATFSGRVEVIQGDTRLKAERLLVHYRQNNSQPAPNSRPPSQRPGGAGSPGGADIAQGISRIEAFGNVFVSSPTETGQGDTGVYDVDKKTITLEGREVVLTRGQNVLKGNRMVMNMDTGQSTLQVAPGERVRGIFVPEQRPAPGQPQRRTP